VQYAHARWPAAHPVLQDVAIRAKRRSGLDAIDERIEFLGDDRLRHEGRLQRAGQSDNLVLHVRRDDCDGDVDLKRPYLSEEFEAILARQSMKATSIRLEADDNHRLGGIGASTHFQSGFNSVSALRTTIRASLLSSTMSAVVMH
jgi:hypothetical protein